MVFEINWEIEPEHWQRWAQQIRAHEVGDDFDRRGLAIDWSPMGTLQMESDGQLLFPPHLTFWWIHTRSQEYRESLNLPTVELGQALPRPPLTIFVLVSGLETVLESGLGSTRDGENSTFIADPETSTGLHFQEHLGYVRISFMQKSIQVSGDPPEGHLRLVADERGCPLVVSDDDFRAEVHQFISEFVQTAIAIAPEFRSWNTWKQFEQFVE